MGYFNVITLEESKIENLRVEIHYKNNYRICNDKQNNPMFKSYLLGEREKYRFHIQKYTNFLLRIVGDL